MSRTVAVAGATGFVGRAIVRELLSRGHKVRGLVRNHDKARKVLPKDENLHFVQGDSADDDAVANLVEGASACINAIGIIREAGGGQTFEKIHVRSVRVLVEACQDAGVSRLAHISALGVREEAPTKYQKSKWQGEVAIANSGLPWTIFRCSTMHGADGEFVQTVKGWVTGKTAPWFFIPYFARPEKRDDVPMAPVYYVPAKISPIAVEDVAWAAAECLDREETIGEIYNLSGPDEFTWPEMLTIFRDAIPGGNRSLQPTGISSDKAAIQARAASIMGLGRFMPFDEGMAIMGAEDATSNLIKARAHFDFQPIGFAERLQQYAKDI